MIRERRNSFKLRIYNFAIVIIFFLNAIMKKLLFPVSIGNNCRPRYQIDQFLHSIVKNYRGNTFFFDSLMMGNLSGVCNIIQRDFIIRKEDIFTREIENKYIPADRDSGMVFLHDFGCRHAYWHNFDECELNLKLSIDESLRKYAYLGEKTKKLLSSNLNIALIYYGRESRESFENLIKLIKFKYNKKINIINVLELFSEEPTVTDGTVINAFVEDSKSPKKGTKQEWQGWNQSWNKALTDSLLIH